MIVAQDVMRILIQCLITIIWITVINATDVGWIVSFGMWMWCMTSNSFTETRNKEESKYGREENGI